MAEKQIWVRATYYDLVKSPVTTVIPKDSLTEDVHVFANGTRERFGRRVDVEIFEWEDNLISASAEGARRAQERIPDKEHFKNTLHDFLVASFINIQATKIIAPRSPAPVSTADIRGIFEVVKQHPAYKNRKVRVESQDGGVVWLVDGVVSVA